MKKRIGLLLTVIILFTGMFYVMADDKNLTKFTIESKVLSAESLSKKVVRLHVIANSDNEKDQAVKLKVKDAVLKEMAPKLNVSKSKEQAIKIIEDNEEIIHQVAVDTLKKNNFSYPVQIVLDQTYFPTKFYNEFSLPAGDYLALRVTIGEGQGKNWWCVLFPPLCLVDLKQEETETSESSVEEALEKSDQEESEDETSGFQEDETIYDNPEEHKDEAYRDNPKEQKNEFHYNNPEEQKDEARYDNSEKSEDNDKSDESENKVKIRWKTLEWLGFY